MTCILLSLCSPALYKKIPINYIILTIFTICNGYLISSLTIISNPLNVTVAFILTFVTVITLTIYAWKSETDFTIYGGVLCSFLAMLVIGSLIMIFFTVSLIVLIIYICLSLCLAFYLVYDVQLLIGNKRNKFDEEDYILATIFDGEASLSQRFI
jgi:FtsH-binding integral membrane protein